MKELIALICIIAFIAITFWHNVPAPKKGEFDEIPTKNEFRLIRKEDETDGVLVITDKDGHKLGNFVLDNNRLWPADRETKEGPLKATLRREWYFIDLGYPFNSRASADLGIWAGYTPRRNIDQFQVGLRYSPSRFVWGSIAAPDALISKDAFGVGASFYPPPHMVDRWLSNFGVGVGKLFPYDGSSPCSLIYTSYSTRF